MGLVCSVVASASVALADPTVYNSGLPAGWSSADMWTFDSDTGGFHTTDPLAFTWSASAQSPLYSPSNNPFSNGGVQASGTLGPSANWIRSQYYSTINATPYNAFVIDYDMPSTTPLDANGNLPTLTLWFQWDESPTDNNSGNNVPLNVSLTADGAWHTLVVPASDFDLGGYYGDAHDATFDQWNSLHSITVGLSGDYTSDTTVGAMFDNVGFADVVPEPASLALFGMSFAAFGLTVRRKLFRS